MTLESQVTSLEISMRLKELGVEYKTLFDWGYRADPSNPEYLDTPEVIGGNPAPYDLDYEPICQAFTVAELYQLHYEKFGTMDKFPVEVHPEELANYIGGILCEKLTI